MTDKPDPQEAQRQREKNRFSALDEVMDRLEPASNTHVAVDPSRIALSSALSLKRIADALEPQGSGIAHLAGQPVTVLLDSLGEQAEVESLAGDMLNIRQAETLMLNAREADELVEKIRRLASAVLRKA